MERRSRADNDLRHFLFRRNAAGDGAEKYPPICRESFAEVQINGTEYGQRFNHKEQKARKVSRRTSVFARNPQKNIHRRDTEFAEFGVFLNEELFPLRPLRLRGKRPRI